MVARYHLSMEKIGRILVSFCFRHRIPKATTSVARPASVPVQPSMGGRAALK